MRSIVWLLLVAVAVAEVVDEPWYEEEDVDESYDDDDASYRKKREVYDPNIDHHRVKRCCEYEKSRKRRSPAVRAPRQVHHYEVHEFTDERLGPASPPYEEMLAASADHYQRYAVPPKSARYLDHSVNHVSGAHVPLKAAQINLSPSESVQFVPIATDPITVVNVDGPAPIHSGPLTQSPKKLDGGDLYGAAAGNHHKHTHGHGHTQGGGHANHGNHHAEHGGKTTKGFSTDHFVDKGGKGYKIDEHHKKEYEDAGGNKKKHHDHAGHQGSHEEEAHGSRGSHFGEKKGHKKGHKTKGYHNKYHKDEFHKEHKFYDDFHKSGEHHRYGKFHAKHASNESGKKKAHRVDAGHDYVERGKKGYSNKGHTDADHKGYDGKRGHEEHHAHHSDHGKKGGKEGGSHWGYAKKH
ncbi:uncharacterized protein LOC114249993 [Bombyx mandarina]|uniref:Uncharacterized protein LOC114249993 n=1 Tax=Bombyx mandarina TaxID=7092 RepID=A0A6J2KB69_BOMMA|nr:uncharacterized protein LOC114249993 [Bombyx mandarina]XP_028039536.1 uncharacterized protein LOC114249993 [Bombyx mandarina]